MNIRKNVDYSDMFTSLNTLAAADLPQMKLYYEIGRVVSAQEEKGAAVAAAGYLQSVFPEMSGFSPRNLRRMREFFRAYENTPVLFAQAMNLNWTQNVVILESSLMPRERAWYIHAAQKSGWSKSELLQKIQSNAHLEENLDLAEETCYTEENDAASEVCHDDREDGAGMEQNGYNTNIVAGAALLDMAENVRGWQKRDCCRQLNDYLYGKCDDRICLVFGLWRTGKTTMLRQAMLEMTPDDLGRTAYIKARRTDTMSMVNRDLERLHDAGYRYIMIDEVTLLPDFIDSAALFSDVFAAMGMKIVLSGTDSLGFWFAIDEELYDRAKMIHTTFIPYREYSRLLGKEGVDEYIRYGGTLRAGETAFDDPDLQREEASFRDNESTRRYIDTAICKNIQNSLRYYEGGTHFRHLYDLYRAGELTGAINRIIEDMTHRFLLDVLTRNFVSGDLGLAARNLRKERDPEKRTTALDQIDTAAVTRRLMELPSIQNQPEQSVAIEPEHIHEIREYLRALDLIVDCPTELAEPGLKPVDHVLFTQPGMRYCQAQALVHSLMKDGTFLTLGEREKSLITERILEEVRGRMLEDIILLETAKTLGRRYKVCKLQFDRGEFDMLIYDREENRCAAFEVKHSRKAVPEQARHLRDDEKCALVRRRFGELAGKYVLYLGDDLDAEDGIVYRNAEKFLELLPQFQMRLGLMEGLDRSENSGPNLQMGM